MPNSTRRDFLKAAGQGTMAAGLAMNLPHGAWITADVQAAPNPFIENKMECDVLVVGGGYAACFAAIKAREQGATVILVDKGNPGRSGQSPFATGTLVFNPAWGDKLEEWMSYTNHVSEYLNNRYWTELTMTESYARYQDMVAWGVPFQKGSDGKPVRDSQPGVVAKQMLFDGPRGEPPYYFREQALKVGVKLVQRVMITELLKQDGRVVGAFGLSPDSDNTYTFVAKTTVLCVGACSYKPAGFPPLHQLTGDGEAMAYRAGAEIAGKEFVDTHANRRDAPLASWNLLTRLEKIPENLRQYNLDLLGKYRVDAAGNRLAARPAEASQYPQTYLRENFAAHSGHAPVYGVVNAEIKNELIAGTCLGMSIRKADGLWPADKECRSTVPGLFAAGDAHGSMQNGAVYAINGSSSMGSAVTGAIAGVAAAKEAAQMSKPNVKASEIARAKEFSTMPRARQGGYSPEWVTQLLQNTMAPYFIYFIKKADRLQSALTQVEFMQQHLVPALIARDPHELRLANETRSMVLSAEMRLRSGLFRTESRGNHYREDHPRRDDQSWMAWTKIRQEQGKMALLKVPMPKEWRADEAMPYEKRYPFRFPGE